MVKKQPTAVGIGSFAGRDDFPGEATLLLAKSFDRYKTLGTVPALAKTQLFESWKPADIVGIKAIGYGENFLKVNGSALGLTAAGIRPSWANIGAYAGLRSAMGFDAVNKVGFLSALGGVGKVNALSGIVAGSAVGSSAASVFWQFDHQPIFASLNTSPMFKNLNSAALFRDLDTETQDEALDAAATFSQADTAAFVEALGALDPVQIESEADDFVSVDLNDPAVRQLLGILAGVLAGLKTLQWQIEHPDLWALIAMLDVSVGVTLAVFALVINNRD